MSKCPANMEISHRNELLLKAEKEIRLKDQQNKPHQCI
jgi:hypothetical protein